MNQVLNIAIFGLSLKVLDQMKKQILLAVPAHVQIKWVNIAEQKIDLLLVNDMFFFFQFRFYFVKYTYIGGHQKQYINKKQ